ncbi:Cof-like hydrolase [Cellulophaga algicola DSM 14237]|uniref:Cof-like hydrolase n=1 Tax=Cellulophaga algicola (strain DSM 14237 / IC166 / ACAM 630) TaxID=688270 RepID=E6X862_CELAD|nr:Cof-type HAD-IIB family hydrolase [Cellulophaga algicola]ADV49688.1 Cof-like hydrolase [Cellulophaga algicola DSM 14237]
MKYKILCSDLDGTLLSTKSDVSEVTISEIKRIKDAVKIYLVSARMPKSMTYLQKDLGIENQPIVCYNGALILHGNTILDSVTIPLRLLKELYSHTEKHAIKLGLYYADEWYVEETSERVQKEIKYTKATPEFRPTPATFQDWRSRKVDGAHKVMLMGTKDSCDAIFPELESRYGDAIATYRSNDTLIEIAPKSVTKLSAIKTLLKADEDLADVIAFGDNYNDMDMLQYVGCGVAVGNARNEVKNISNYIAEENTAHGVAKFIKEHLCDSLYL